MPSPNPLDALPTYVCPQCQLGTLTPQWVTFARWFDEQFIIIPNFPGWVCDACRLCQYDEEALAQLGMILGSEANLRREASRRARQTPADPFKLRRPGSSRRVR